MDRMVFPQSINKKTVTLMPPSDQNLGDLKYRDSAKESTTKKKEQLEVSLQYKKECFKRSKQIVEQLLEREISEQILLQSVSYISQSDYEDVIVERAIIKICGYPICSSDLPPAPKKQCHISTATNKVYDLTDRKNFCSNWCYKASSYLKDQISTCPVWFREVQNDYHLLTRVGNSGKAGEEIAMEVDKLKLSDKKVGEHTRSTISSFAFTSLEQYQDDGIFDYNLLEIKEANIEDQNKSMEVIVEPERKKELVVPKSTTTTCWANGGTPDLSLYEIPRAPKQPKTQEVIEKPSEEPALAEEKVEQLEVIRKVAHRSEKLPTNVKPESVKFDAAKVVAFVTDWFSLDTLRFIIGPEKMLIQLREKIDVLALQSSRPEWIPTVENELIHLCKEMDQAAGDTNQTEMHSTLQMKVEGFFKGKTSHTVGGEASKVGAILPTIDRYEQRRTRQKIILARLEKVVPEVADILKLNLPDLGLKLQKLTDTFELSPKNIMMKPQEWNLMGLILLQLLLSSYSEPQRFVAKKSSKILKAMLITLNLEADFLDNLIIKLCDIERIVSKSADVL
ncbi:putative RNA polymerase II subunit B1 CTD phosphatase RPAP2 [Neocloeon triangulifer]|uniref:putative RNA polymerase II subunit B1 CTD phosphatase RPAP2 n=1 Tax=Neocloeon triangulifer TaxID=2078957 RepID=UPI00286F8EEF|nr:putative RNA polymerase II subunit B1 CTD phosphatase RPAP2 [Neocloeon triangulifer]